MEKITWNIKAFNALSVNEYFELLYLRVAVFVVEQNCPYQEVDEKDRKSFHLVGKTEKGALVAVARILPQGIAYAEASIGRVALKKEYRGKGFADLLMLEALKFIEQKLGKQPIRISAQKHLLNYYAKHGFQPTGKTYLEDGIPHIEMLRA